MGKHRMIRSKIARAISETGLPGSRQAAALIRTKEANADLSESARVIVEGIVKKQDFADEMAAKFPDVAKWLTPEKAKLFEGIGNIAAVHNGLWMMQEWGTPEQIAEYFKKYATSDVGFVAIITAAGHLFQRYVEWGYVKSFPDRPPEQNYDDDDQPAMFVRSMDWYTEHICRADTTLDYDTVKKDLIENIFKPE